MRTSLTFASLLALALFGLASRPAHADSTCSADSDCVKGWTCLVSGGVACASPACPPGEKCEAQPSDCSNVEYKSCQPGPCRADSDCADGMVCYTHTETACPPTACAAGQVCAPAPCETKTESACTPRYMLPCTTANDCGTGFQCEPDGEQCSCSGSAGENKSDGGTPVPVPDPSCICEPSKDLRCHAATVSCAQDSDCSVGWTCAASASAGDCGSALPPAPPSEPNASGGAQGGGAQGGGTQGGGAQGGGAQGGGATPSGCLPSAPAKQCVPPYYALIQGSNGVARDSASGPTLGAADPTVDHGSVPATAESSQDDGGTSSAGCSLAHGSRTGGSLALLGVLGLFGALRRRRAG